MSDRPIPETVSVKAIVVKPYRWSLWCAIEDGEPFANEICGISWSKDGTHVWFMLESHNFYKAKPEDMIDLVPMKPGFYSDAFLTEYSDKRHAEFLTKCPTRQPVTK